MKKGLTNVLLIVAVIGVAFSSWRIGYSLRKSTDNLPTLTAIAEMSEADVNSLLPGYKINQLKTVWGEPDTSEENRVSWEIGDITLIVNYKNNGVIAICSLKDDSGASAGENSWAIAAHFYLDEKEYFYNGKLTYELPEGYEYVGDVINVGDTFSGKDFEGNVDGKIYKNQSISDTAYFSWAEWDEEIDGPAPFLKLEVKESN